MNETQILNAALQFLSRAELRGAEAATFMQTMQGLTAMRDRAQATEQAAQKARADAKADRADEAERFAALQG